MKISKNNGESMTSCKSCFFVLDIKKKSASFE